MEDFNVNRDENGNWSVFLPHQCDSWCIAGDESYRGVPHEEAVNALKEFLADGQKALEALMRREKYRADSY